MQGPTDEPATVGRIDAGPAELDLGVGEWKTAHVEADTVYRFCRALGCPSDYLVSLTDDPTPANKRPPSRKAAPVG